LSRVIGSLLTATLTLFIGWILLGLDINASKKISSENQLKNKADITYVDSKDDELHKSLRELKAENKETNTKQDAKVETMRLEWREDQKEILKRITELHK